MKKTGFVKKALFAALVAVMSVTAFSESINLSSADENPAFSDVEPSSYYYEDVNTAYSMGLINGTGGGLFSPDGSVTVAEGITLASRIHASCMGNNIPDSDSGEWYDEYVSYAENNGLITSGQFENYSRNMLRYEMAVLFANAMPEDNYTPVNAIDNIPDIDAQETYHDDVLKLYNAGIVIGATEYGDFFPTSTVTRGETAVIVTRTVIPEKRIQKTLKEYGRRNQAVFLINDYTMMRTVRSKTNIASGWKYENTSDFNLNSTGGSTSNITDKSYDHSVSIHRDVTTVYDGIVELEIDYTPVTPGYSIVISDIDGNNMFTFGCTSDEKHYSQGDSRTDIDFTYSSDRTVAYFAFNLDTRKAKIVINGKELGEFDMSSSAGDISRLSIVTDKDSYASVALNKVYMYTNYIVNDLFRTTPIGGVPYGWSTNGDVTVEYAQCDLDTNSVRMNEAASASKAFETVSGKFVYETFVRVPDGQQLEISLKNGTSKALTVMAYDGKFSCGDNVLRSFNPNIWQLIRIEADTIGKTALIKINNKSCLTLPFEASGIDSVEITSHGVGYAWFDDVELYNVYDYADYCPQPVPVTDDGWYTGMSVCSLWREGTHYGWDSISPYEELTPLMGYYDEGLPEVADWEIKMLVEHGYDFQHFCWYAGSISDGIKEPRLCDALHNGYMNAKYSHMQDFMLMWENNGYGYTSFDFFKENVWDYWCDWYFTDDRYFTIDNKPVLTIYQYTKFINTMGGNEGAAQAIAFMKEDIKKLGYDGMIILFCSRGANATENELFAELGADAMIAYNFGENSYDAQYQISCMNSAFDAGHLSLMPCVGVGFNDIGWTETRTPNATPEAHKQVLEWAKSDYMPRLDEREEEDWKSRFVISNTWNEYGEGHYIMPSSLNGFGYVDAARQVFSSVAGTDDSTHFDVAPTINQKKRLGYLYPNRTQPIKRTHHIDNSLSLEDLISVKSWDMEKQNDAVNWIPLMQMSSLGYDEEEKALLGVSAGIDPAITFIGTTENQFEAEDVKYIRVRMKIEKPVASSSSMFFMTTDDTSYVSQRGVNITVNGFDGQYHDYYFDMSSNKYWQGTIKRLRFDPCSHEGNFYIKSIDLLNEDFSSCFSMNIDSVDLILKPEFYTKTEDEIFAAFDPSYGFYSLNNFYTEWNRHTGELMLKTGTDHVFNFTVGSDTALVDGVPTALPDEISLIDGLPLLPLTFIYDHSEMDYSYTDNHMKVSVRSGEYYDIITSRVDYEYEFKIDSDHEGWAPAAVTSIVANDCMEMTSVPTGSGRYDPVISNTTVNIDAELYTTAEIRLKVDYADTSSYDTSTTIYFATTDNPTLDEKKTSRVHLNTLTPDSDGFYTVTFKLHENELWDGTVKTVRFDPPNRAGTYYVDYIRFIKDPEAEQKAQEELLKAMLREERLSVADEGGPFFVENADAEDSTLTPLASNYVFAEDSLIQGNHAIEHVLSGASKNWAYITIPTRFKPGVTYKVELDVRVTKDHLGNDVENATLAWNLRYGDIVDGVYKESADHFSGVGSFSTSDGWKHVSFTHTISENSLSRDRDTFAFYANPQTAEDGSYRNIGYMIDNITVSVVE